MGSGSRFKISKHEGVGLGVYIDTFPFSVTVNVSVLFWTISLGFGKAYDE